MPKTADATDPKPDAHAGVRRQITEGSVFDTPYALMNVLATVVACFGLLENSAAVVIGAMLIAMLLGPISGIALALVAGDMALLRRALLAEVCGVLLVLATSFALGRFYRDLPLGGQILSRTSPNVLDLFIALAGGAAGAYATITPKLRAGLVGVAVATALVPPLSVCGLCLARGETGLAWGGFLLFFANFVRDPVSPSPPSWGCTACTGRCPTSAPVGGGRWPATASASRFWPC